MVPHSIGCKYALLIGFNAAAAAPVTARVGEKLFNVQMRLLPTLTIIPYPSREGTFALEAQKS